MSLKTYRQEAINSASNGTVISLSGGDDVESGQAAFKFAEHEGYYNVVVGYYDEGDGASELEVSLNQRVLDSWALNQQLGGTSAGPKTAVQRVVGEQLWIRPGDRLKLTALENGGEHARVDYVEFIPLETPDPILGTRKRDRRVGTDNGDIIRTLGGKDRAIGKNGDDLIYGGNGADRIKGQRGNDYLYGERGADILVGGADDDWLDGGKNADVYIGGKGCDTYVLQRGRHHDVIRDCRFEDFLQPI
ncbi:MAG: calcium-binding protein [Cyanobacteria bacterium P01_E01_bin.6]